MTVGEAIERNLRGAKGADPIEFDNPKNGGPNKAMLRHSKSKGWYIHSMIHGRDGIDYLIEAPQTEQPELLEQKEFNPFEDDLEEFSQLDQTLDPTVTTKKTEYLMVMCPHRPHQQINTDLLRKFEKVNGQWSCSDIKCKKATHKYFYNKDVRSSLGGKEAHKVFTGVLNGGLAFVPFESNVERFIFNDRYKLKTIIPMYGSLKSSKELDALAKHIAEKSIERVNSLRNRKINALQRDAIYITVRRIIEKVFFEKIITIDISNDGLKKKSLRNAGAKPHMYSIYQDYRTLSINTETILDVMESLGYVDVVCEGDLCEISITEVAARYSARLEYLIDENVIKIVVDDSNVRFPIYGMYMGQKVIKHLTEHKVRDSLSIYDKVLESVNRMTSHMSFTSLIPNAKLYVDNVDSHSLENSLVGDIRHLGSNKEYGNPHGHFIGRDRKIMCQGKTLKFVPLDDLHTIMACGHGLYQKSVALLRKAHMQWMSDTSINRGYSYNGIPCVITSEGIYTNAIGEAEIGAIKMMLNIGCYQFFPERKRNKKGSGPNWWEGATNPNIT